MVIYVSLVLLKIMPTALSRLFHSYALSMSSCHFQSGKAVYFQNEYYIFFVLLVFRDNLLEQNHSYKLLILIFAFVKSSFKLELEVIKVVSSANDEIIP